MASKTSGKSAWDKEKTRELFRRFKGRGRYGRPRKARHVPPQPGALHRQQIQEPRGASIDDLVQVGYLGLLKAIDRFDPARGLEFTTFATPTIMGEIKRHFRDKGWSVRVPRRLQELSAKVNQATDTLTSQLQRSPTIAEIAEYLDATVDEVLEAMESSLRVQLGLARGPLRHGGRRRAVGHRPLCDRGRGARLHRRPHHHRGGARQLLPA